MHEQDFKDRELHFIAIGGAGMSALALACHELGARVTGSDRAESSYLERVRAAGIAARLGHDAGAVPEGADVIVSTAIRDDNPELARARERGQRVLHRGELLAELCSTKRLLAVAGTHGKTTTAAMAAWALRALGEDPAFLLGGELAAADPGGEATNASWGAGEWIVAEADESDASFLRLRPEVAAVTSVELDHHSRWPSLTELLGAFREFAAPASGLALLADPSLDRIAGEQRVLRFGASLLEREPNAPAPAAGAPWEPPAPPRIATPGAHNLLNAHAAVAALELAGFDPERAARALADFPGVWRRMELKGRRNGALVYDDYAHHPTEVAAAVEAARELRPRRLIAVFQPHLYSRTKALARELGAALASADEVGVLEVYPAREDPVGVLEGVTGRWVAEAAADRAGGRPVWWLRDAAAARRMLAPRLGEGDLLLVLGAGDIGELLADPLTREDGGEPA